jgi:hypothetical protein
MSRDIKYIGYVENEIADSISSSGLCRVRWAAEALIAEERGPCVACRTSSLGIVRRSRQELTPARRHLMSRFPRHLLEQALKLRMPVYRLSRCIKSILVTDSSESTISRISAILQKLSPSGLCRV